jgi:hypothetical protein
LGPQQVKTLVDSAKRPHDADHSSRRISLPNGGVAQVLFTAADARDASTHVQTIISKDHKLVRLTVVTANRIATADVADGATLVADLPPHASERQSLDSRQSAPKHVKVHQLLLLTPRVSVPKEDQGQIHATNGRASSNWPERAVPAW